MKVDEEVPDMKPNLQEQPDERQEELIIKNLVMMVKMLGRLMSVDIQINQN